MNEKLNIVSLLEQFETAVIDTAPIIAGYYKKLIEDGIPVDLAEQLTVDWHRIFWSSQFPSNRNE